MSTPQISTPKSSRSSTPTEDASCGPLRACRCCCCTTGAKFGGGAREPLAYQVDGDRYVIFASKAGPRRIPTGITTEGASERHDRVGTDTIDVAASEASGEGARPSLQHAGRARTAVRAVRAVAAGRVIP